MTRRFRLSLGSWRRLCKKINPSRSQLKWHTELAYCLSGAIHSCLFRLQNASHREALNVARPYPPVFLLGFWRSGTTLLHEILCRDPQFGFPSTYACLNPSYFLLTEAWFNAHHAQHATRPMDAMSYSWASPQEDEFALLALGAPSPYEALVVPSLLQEPRALLDLGQRTGEEQRRWTEAVHCFLSLLTVRQAKPILLKSPPHGFRFPLLLATFPQSLYIIIERNPYEVFASNLKLWQTLLELYALESWTADEIEKFVLEAYILHEEALAEGSRLARPNQLARVRYEDLIADPIGKIEGLYRELKLAHFEQAREAMEKYTETLAGYTRNRFVLSPAQKDHVDSNWGSLIEAKGYTWPGEYLKVRN